MPFPLSWYPTLALFLSRNSCHSKWNAAVGLSSWNSLVLPYCPPSWTHWLNSGMNFWKLRYNARQVAVSCRAGQSSPAVDQHPIPGAVSSIVSIHEARNQGVEMLVTPLTIIPSGSIAKFLLLAPTNCVLLPWDLSSKEEIHDFIELEVKTAPQPLWAPYLSESRGKEWSYCAG